MSENNVQNKINFNDLNLENNSRMTYKEIDVTVPITIEPSADLGDACVEIIGDPCIIPLPCCMRKSNCQYAIRQRLVVTFPVEFNAVASSGNPFCCKDNSCSGSEVEDSGIKIKKINKDNECETSFLFRKKSKK